LNVSAGIRTVILAGHKPEHAMKTPLTTLAILAAIAGGVLPQAGYAGNAHSAATAGMTYHGDPISGPTSPLPQPQQMQPAARSQPVGTAATPSMMQATPAGNSQ
jgi:hypothetical protein